MTLPMRDVSTTAFSANVSDQGAHLVSWIPTGQPPVLWLSTEAVFARGVAIRGGVPIVFPWFGAGRTGHDSPAHGFARIVDWTMTRCSVEATHSELVYTLDQRSPEFGFSYLATYRIRIDDVLSLSLTIENHDSQPFSFEEALHTYLHVSDVAGVSVIGLEDTAYHDKVTGLAHRSGSEALRFSGETDRVYHSTASVSVNDSVGERVIEVAKTNSANTVVWNPWVTKAAALTDMPDDAWRQMLCIEAGNIGDDAVFLNPGERHELGCVISVATL